MRMRFIQDTPILSDEQDGLGFGRFVDLVHNSILQTDTPFVYGILGDWGAGKTSAMQVLKRRLEQGLAQKTSFNVPIWLNVWKYENEANMIYPILYCIKKDFEVRLKSEAATASCLSALVKVVGGSALALTDLGFRVITKPSLAKP